MPREDTIWKDRLRAERIRHNWRQSDLAEHLGTSVVTVQRWEKGHQHPSAYFRIKLEALFGPNEREEKLEGSHVPGPQPAVTPIEATSTVPSSISQDDALPLWNVPHPRNPHFTGREDLLEHLHHHLKVPTEKQMAPGQAALTQTQAIKGLGGIGKTQIAVEYAYRAAELGRYTHTLWLNAASEETVLTSFAALAELLPNCVAKGETDQHKLVVAVKHWLEQCEQPWLLIVDNADELSLVQSSLPQRGKGSILLTTRAHAVGFLAPSLAVETMGWVEGMQFLLHRSQRLSASEQESNEAIDVVMALDGFPLALDQAGAYIEETGCSFADYVQLYHDHHQELLARRGKQATNYPDSVATTWSLSFQKVEQANPATAELLRLCAFLAPDRIPEELLIEGRAQWPAVLQLEVATPLAFNHLLETLLAFSLVKRLAEDRLLSIHRLVQVVQRARMEPEEQYLWAERVVRGVHMVFPTDPKFNVASRPACLRYLEQAQTCDGLIQQHHLLLPEAAEVLNRTGLYLYMHASHSLAEPLYRRALWIWEHHPGSEPPGIVTTLNHLALISKARGKYAEAEALYRQALQIWERQFRPDHPEIAHVLNNLAILYRAQEKYTEAEALHWQAQQIWEREFGPDHPWICFSLNGLANLHVDRGTYTEAEPLYLRALQIWEQRFGSGHPGIANPLNSLAELYLIQERYTEAEALYQKALSIREQHLGPEHPDVANSLNGLANLHVKQGNYPMAASLYQRALHIREHAFGPLHLDIAKTLYSFAQLQELRGNLSEAASLYRRSLEIREQSLGLEHARTREIRESLHAVLTTVGQAKEVQGSALSFCKECL